VTKVTRADAPGGRGGKGGAVLLLLTATVAASACEPGEPLPADRPAATPPQQAPAELALKTPSGTEVWFGDGRESRDTAGAICIERTLEIRGPNGKRIVPLLYTLDTPTVLDDSTIRARLFTDCRPGPVYRVDLRTGLPVRKDP
jgi:hypothetical protein